MAPNNTTQEQAVEMLPDAGAEEKKEEIPSTQPPAKLWGSCRLVLVILCNLGLFHLMLMRFNISVAIVCMTTPDVKAKEQNVTLESEVRYALS